MDSFTHKSLITKPHSLTYSYYLSPDFHRTPRNASIPTLMFVHGFPDDAFMWAGAIEHMRSLAYPILVLDILGMGGSSKPADTTLYNYRKQADAIAQILEIEGLPDRSVIPIGHDWGSAISQRFYLYHKAKCAGLALLSLAYQIPSAAPFDLDDANEATTRRFGYPQWEYWNFFTAPDAADLMRENLGRFYAVNNGHLPSPVPEEKGRDVWMREMFCTPGAMREYIAGSGKYADGWTVELKSYPHGERVRQRFIERLSRDGLEGPVNYYHALKNNTMLEDERALCDTPGDKARKIEVPMLYIGETGDWVCRTDLMDDAKKAGLVDDLEEKVVQAGHWVLYEKPDEIAELLMDWLGRKFPVAA